MQYTFAVNVSKLTIIPTLYVYYAGEVHEAGPGDEGGEKAEKVQISLPGGHI